MLGIVPRVLVFGKGSVSAGRLREALKGSKLEVLSAQSSAAAVKRLRRGDIDAVLLDFDGCGEDAIREAAAAAPGAAVIAVGEARTRAARAAATRAGAREYVAWSGVKGCDIEQAARDAAAHREAFPGRDDEEWQRIFNAIPDLVCVLDSAYRIVMGNLAMARHAGLEVRELAGRRCHEVMHGMCEPPEGCPHRLAVLDGKAHTVELRDDRSGGTFLVSSAPIGSRSGRRRTFVHVVRDVSAQKRAELEAHQSEERYRDLVENLSDVIHLVDREGRVTYASPSAVGVFGSEADRLVGRKIDSFFTAEDRAPLRETIRKALEGEESSGTYRMPDAEGRTRWLRLSYRPVRSGGQVTGLSGVMTDVTDRRRAADALQRSYDLLDETQRLAKMGGWHMDLASGRVLWSEGVYSLYGVGRDYDPCDMGRNFSFFVPEAVTVVARAFRDIIEHGRPYDLTLEFIRANGERIWVRTLGTPVLRNGQVYGVRGYLMDVTEAVRARNVIVEANANKQAILDNVGVGIALIGTDMRLRECSGHMVDWFPSVRADGGALCYQTLRNPPRDEPCEDCPMRAAAGDGKGCEAEFSLQRNGVARQYRATASAAKDATGAVVGAVEIVDDVTDRVGMENRLRHQQRLESIGLLAGGVAHEVNNPINGIMGYAQLMLDSAESGSQAESFGREIIHECERVSAIVRDLLSFARQDVEELAPAKLEDVLQSSLALLRALIRRDGIKLDVGDMTGLPTIRCRKGPIRQVLMNLLTNAKDALNAKYPPGHEDKVLQVRAAVITEDGKVWLRTTVEDHGVGIAQENRERIFDPFFTTKPRDQGTGLGLSVSYGIVKEHGGRLDFQSETGKWTRFTLDLPVRQISG